MLSYLTKGKQLKQILSTLSMQWRTLQMYMKRHTNSPGKLFKKLKHLQRQFRHSSSSAYILQYNNPYWRSALLSVPLKNS